MRQSFSKIVTKELRHTVLVISGARFDTTDKLQSWDEEVITPVITYGMKLFIIS